MFLYIRPFLVVSCSSNNMQKTSQIDIIARSIASELSIFIMCWDFDFIPSLLPNLYLKQHRSDGERFAISLIGYNMQAMLFNPILDVVIAKSMHVTPIIW